MMQGFTVSNIYTLVCKRGCFPLTNWNTACCRNKEAANEELYTSPATEENLNKHMPSSVKEFEQTQAHQRPLPKSSEGAQTTSHDQKTSAGQNLITS